MLQENKEILWERERTGVLEDMDQTARSENSKSGIKWEDRCGVSKEEALQEKW